jgi:Mycothiol maleylpyruvate isomerase N-terminal domain
MATCAGVDASSPTIDLDSARAALRRTADDFAALIASAPDPDQRIPDSEWTVRDVAVHVALGSEAYVEYAAGGTEAWVDISDIAGGSLARSSAARLAAEPARDLLALATRAKAAVGALIEATEGRSGDELVMWNGMSTPRWAPCSASGSPSTCSTDATSPRHSAGRG